MRPRPTLPRLTVLLASASAAACGGGDGSPAPIVPSRITFAAQPDSAIVGDTVALGGAAVDASGRAATTYPVTYTSADTTVARVDAAGVVRFVKAGATIVTAHVTGLPGGGTLTQPTASLVVLAPAARIRALPSRLDVVPGTTASVSAAVYDAGGNRISYPVRYGTDNAAVANVATAATGSIAVGAAGTATVSVQANFRGRGVSTTLPVTAAPVAAGPFHISLVPLGTPNPAYTQLFAQAAAFWENVITAALPSAAVDLPADVCGDGGPALQTTTTGVTIYFTIDSIDGPGKILGAAGPCVLRQDASSQQRGLTVLGTMVFDSADIGRLVQRGTAGDVIRHEMGHVLGIGTLWNVNGVRTDLVGVGSDPQYVGSAGAAASAVLGFTSAGASVPVENTGGSGTANSHWRATTYGNELMVGYLGAGTSHPASRLTVLSLADLGYQVNVAASEPLLPATPAALQATRAAATDAADRFTDVALRPLFAVRPAGGLLRLRTPPPAEAALRPRRR